MTRVHGVTPAGLLQGAGIYVGTVTGCIPAGGGGFTHLHSVQTGTGPHLVSYPKGTRNVKIPARIHLVQQCMALRLNSTIHFHGSVLNLVNGLLHHTLALPSSSFPVHHSLIIPLLDTIQSEIVAMSVNTLPIYFNIIISSMTTSPK
jgi:hypothetical protein